MNVMYCHIAISEVEVIFGGVKAVWHGGHHLWRVKAVWHGVHRLGGKESPGSFV